MQFHTFASKTKHRVARRIGRGGSRGTYSGRGIKGQRSRAGAKIRPAERDILKRLPKLRGYKFRAFRAKPAIVSIESIERSFPDRAVITPQELLRKGLVKRVKGRVPRVKILSSGTLAKKFVFKEVTFSKSAQQKVAP
ncbi:MAG: uL15 family ribosomal protein [Candidatus Sungbacteria bacterium]|nr:uL15 family ribosomal protein [Candidatus Sungbacteria bacterium]